MRRKRLYRQALASFQQGYIDGAQSALATAAARETARPNYWGPKSASDHDGSPAHSAGYDSAYRGERVNTSRLPLDVWVKVLAKAQEPC